MSRQLRMSAELGDWMTGLSASGRGSPQAIAAAEVGAALTAVLDAPDIRAVTLVADPAATDADDFGDPRATVDRVYQELLEALGAIRRAAADAATWRASTRLRVTETGSQPHPFSAEERRALADRERILVERQQRYQLAADQFRTAKETAKASYTAADAMVRVQTALASADDDEIAGPAGDSADAMLAAAAEQIAALIADGRRMAACIAAGSDGSETGSEASADGDQPVIAPGLLELRADPLGSQARLLFAEEPAGTITLLAVLDDAAAVREHEAKALALAGELLGQIRESGWPPADEDPAAREVCFAGSGAFLARFFPLSAARIRERAAELAAGTSLALLREARGVSLADMARLTGTTATDLRRLETSGLADAPPGSVSAYLRALGGRLTLTASFDDGPPERLS